MIVTNLNKWKPEYVYSFDRDENQYHTWTLRGSRFTVCLNITVWHKENENAQAGVEFHFRQPPPHMDDEPPSHDHCPYTGGNCWHDGTSSYAREKFLPLWQAGCNHHHIFNALAEYANEQDQNRLQE